MSAEQASTVRVVHTIASLDRASGGPARVVPGIADALTEVGCEVTIVCMRSVRGNVPLLPRKAANVAARAWTLRGVALWSHEFPHAIRRLAQGGDALVHDNGLWTYANFAASRAAMRSGVPLIISPHGMLGPWALRSKSLKKRLARSLYQQSSLEAAVMFVVSSDSEFEAVRQAGLRQPVAVVAAGLALPEAAAAHAISSSERRMLFMSRLNPSKGLIPFVRAWEQVRPVGWKMVIAGPDEIGHRAEVERAVARAGLQAQFEFCGEVEGAAKQALLESADVCVLPTFSENFGIAVAEGLAHGLPVLTTRGAPWQVLEQINAGWWVEPTVDGLAGGLRAALATSSAQRAAMGQAGRQYASSQLSWHTAAQKTLDAYLWALGRLPGRPAHVHLS